MTQMQNRLLQNVQKLADCVRNWSGLMYLSNRMGKTVKETQKYWANNWKKFLVAILNYMLFLIEVLLFIQGGIQIPTAAIIGQPDLSQ
mgnify:CR=1 FL=1